MFYITATDKYRNVNVLNMHEYSHDTIFQLTCCVFILKIEQNYLSFKTQTKVPKYPVVYDNHGINNSKVISYCNKHGHKKQMLIHGYLLHFLTSHKYYLLD